METELNHSELKLIEALESDSRGFKALRPEAIQARSERIVATRSDVSRGVYSAGTLRGWVGYAAVVVCMLVIIGINYIPNHTTPPTTKTYTTAPAQRANITLADGSRVTLAPATRLTVTGRNIELHGEAVFTVSQHDSDPFTVKAGNTTTRVLGTTFGVRTYDKSVRVAVSDGKVSVDSYILTSGNVAIVTDTSSQVLYNADVTELLAWTKGELVFRNLLVSDALAQLSRWYDLQFKVADPELNDRHINTTVTGNILTDEELHNLAEAIGARMERKGQTVVLRSINP